MLYMLRNCIYSTGNGVEFHLIQTLNVHEIDALNQSIYFMHFQVFFATIIKMLKVLLQIHELFARVFVMRCAISFFKLYKCYQIAQRITFARVTFVFQSLLGKRPQMIMVFVLGNILILFSKLTLSLSKLQ